MRPRCYLGSRAAFKYKWRKTPAWIWWYWWGMVLAVGGKVTLGHWG